MSLPKTEMCASFESRVVMKWAAPSVTKAGGVSVEDVRLRYDTDRAGVSMPLLLRKDSTQRTPEPVM